MWRWRCGALCACAQIILRIAGTGVTPFGPANQERLIQVLAYGARNISSAAFHVVLVADAFSSRRRALLAWPWESVQVRVLKRRFAHLLTGQMYGLYVESCTTMYLWLWQLQWAVRQSCQSGNERCESLTSCRRRHTAWIFACRQAQQCLNDS